MKYQLTQEFYFEAAHTLDRTIETESSRRIHGHTYHARISIEGIPDGTTGMIVDLAIVRAKLETLRDRLDHRFLNEEADIGPVTLENLCRYIWFRLVPDIPGLTCVTVERRASGDQCSLTNDD